MDFYKEKLEGIQVSFVGCIQSFTKLGGPLDGDAFLSSEMSVDSPQSLQSSVNVRVFWMPDPPILLRRVLANLEISTKVYVAGRLVESDRALSVIARVFEIQRCDAPTESVLIEAH